MYKFIALFTFSIFVFYKMNIRVIVEDCLRCSDYSTIQRKISLFYCSEKGHVGAKVLVIYHTFIEMCKMCGVSTLEYFKKFFNAAIKRVQSYAYISFAEREQLRFIPRQLCREDPTNEASADSCLHGLCLARRRKIEDQPITKTCCQ